MFLTLSTNESFIYFDWTDPPPILVPSGLFSARRKRCSMNHADFWVTPKSRAIS